MASIKIPKRFKLIDQTIEVIYENNLAVTDDVVGFAEYRLNRIRLQSPKGFFSKSQTESAFWHEVIHYILYTMRENELRNNEKFVGIFADLLNQVFKTSEY